MIDTLNQVLAHMSTTQFWLAFFTGLAIATAIGLIPGIGATIMMAIAFPIVLQTFDEPAVGVVMLAVITGTGNTFDSLPAQLMGVTSGGTQVSFLEGHQLARKGLAAYSLGAVYAVSAIGGLVGAFALLMVMEIAEPLILMLGYPELATISIFGLAMVSVLSKGAMSKGLASASIGVFLGTVGLQGFTNTERFTFGEYDLRGGLPLVAVVAGIMAIPDMLDLAASRKPVAPPDADMSNREVFRGFKEGLRNWMLAVRHSILGVTLGAIPGTGGSFVTWMSYGVGVASSKDKREFGKGSLRGLMFAESAENAKEGGQAIPSLALGIPGGTSWALVIAALLAYGISPGPRLMEDHLDVVWLIVISFALANLMVTMLALVITRQIVKITQIPFPAIIGTVLPITVLGAYFSDPFMLVVVIMCLAGALGLVMKHFRWPRPPLVLGFVLAVPIEENLFTSVQLFGWHMLTRPFTIILAVVAIFIVWLLLRSMKKTAKMSEDVLQAQAADDPDGEAAVLLAEDESSGSAITGSPVSPSSGSSGGVATNIEKPLATGRRLQWRSEHWVALGFTLIGAYIFLHSISYERVGAVLLPAVVAVVLIICAGSHLIRLVLFPKDDDAEILDIAMLSVGMEGARRTAFTMAGLLVMYLLLIYAVGLKWAGVPFAILVPLLLMKEGKRVLSAAISVILYLAFAIYVGDNLLHILWPDGRFMW